MYRGVFACCACLKSPPIASRYICATTCTTFRAGVGSVGRLAGAASSTRLVTRHTAQAARLRHREGATDRRGGNGPPWRGGAGGEGQGEPGGGRLHAGWGRVCLRREGAAG